MQVNFGVGLLEFTPPGSNPTPVQIGILQEVTIDVDRTLKELYGQYQAPVDVAMANLKITGKAKNASIFGAALNQIMSGSTLTTGTMIGQINEVGTIPGTPYQITVANSATFVEDLGVYNAVTGVRMTRVASAPATGQYAVAAGVYTFAAADTGVVMWISYRYSAVTGKTVAFTNQLMGAATTFTATLFNTYNSKNVGYKFYAVAIPKLSMALKNTEYTDQNLDFQAYANTSGQVFDFYSTE